MEEREDKTANRHGRRGSLFGPLILVAIGVILLLNNLGAISGDFWETLFRFWPVILIAIGLDGIYRGEGMVGAAFMIGIGVIFLLANLGYLTVNVWQVILRLWPLLLVAVGFDILIGRRSFIASLIGLIVMLAILAGALWLLGARVERSQAVMGEEIRQDLQGAARATVSIQPSAGALQLEALAETDALIAGRVAARSSQSITDSFSLDGDRANYTLREGEVTFYFPGRPGAEWDWDLGLNAEIPIDLEVNLGAGEAHLDLTGLELSALEVNMGVGETEVRLPDEGQFDGAIESAIGQVVITVPRGMAVRIDANPGLATVQAPPNFMEREGVYLSPGYEDAQNRVDLEVSQAIGIIRILEVGE